MKQFMFWSYDSFPFVLGGVVKTMRDNGTAEPVGYDGYSFRPLCILPLKDGLQKWKELEEIKDRHDATINMLRRMFRAEAEHILPVIRRK